jgi:hypothetical protein
MAIDMATLPVMIHSFLTDCLHAPVPDPTKEDTNLSRKLYTCYLQRTTMLEAYATGLNLINLTFIEFARLYRLGEAADGKYKIKPRITGRGKHATKSTTAIGIRFAWDLLDIFIGQFCAMFFVHSNPSEFITEKKVPEGSRFLQGALDSKAVYEALQRHKIEDESYKDMSVFDYLWRRIQNDLILRGAKKDRIQTLHFRLQAVRLLLESTARGEVNVDEWSAKRPNELPDRNWSVEQTQFLNVVAESLKQADANVEGERFLFLTGEPGSGKTEVIIYAAARAASTGAKVLIGCPTGALVTTYRDRLPGSDCIVVETIHSAFAIRRKARLMTKIKPISNLFDYQFPRGRR